MPASQQLSFRHAFAPAFPSPPLDRRRALLELLKGDLDFAGQDTGRASHSFHPFAAKFPPALPREFIQRLSRPGETVLDPMMGSGTTPVEAVSLGRHCLGADLDPLSLWLTQAKTTAIHPEALHWATENILPYAREQLTDRRRLRRQLGKRFGAKEREFLDYWFPPQTQMELLALRLAIEQVRNEDLRRFLDVAFSAIIIAKSGGVTWARDLAHSRPHKVADKTIRPALEQFEKRLRRNLAGLADLKLGHPDAPRQLHVDLRAADARHLPFETNTADLIVTSPPYANAIDYMRAHKFTLVWLERSLSDLTELRATYLGAERRSPDAERELPDCCARIVAEVNEQDQRMARTLHQYLAQMSDVLADMARVLKPGRALVLVVGPSTMRGVPVPTHDCLAELVETAAGLEMVGMSERKIDRNRRMMPARHHPAGGKGIEARIHHEYVLGAIKPECG